MHASSSIGPRSVWRPRLAALSLAFSVALHPGLARADAAPSVLEMARTGDFAGLAERLPNLAAGPDRLLADARIASGSLDGQAAREAIARLQNSPDPVPGVEAYGWSLLANLELALGEYAAAAEAARHWQASLPAGSDPTQSLDAAQLLAVAQPLSAAPQQELGGASAGRIATHRDALGLRRANVRIGSESFDAVLDTGASLSVLSRSAAERLGIRMLGAGGTVRSSTQAEVPVHIGIADEVEIAGARLRNVAFLVTDDAALSFPGGLRIDAVIGIPVFRALGRISFTRQGLFSWSGTSAAAPGGPQDLHADGNTLYVDVTVQHRRYTLHLDTGATHSDLSAIAVARQPTLVAGKPHVDRQVSGAGGTVHVPVVELHDVPVSIDGHAACLARMDATLEAIPGAAAQDLGTLGQDMLGLYASYTIDFRAMRFEVSGGGRCARPRRARSGKA